MDVIYELDEVFKTVKYSNVIHRAIIEADEKLKLKFPKIEALKLILRKKPVEAIFPDGQNPRVSYKNQILTIWIDFYYMPEDSSMYEELSRVFNYELKNL